MMTCVVISIAIPVSVVSCTSPCGLKLQQHVFLPATAGGVQRDTAVPCCGGSAYRDVDLSTAGDIEVDITNPSAVGSMLDGYLTVVGCDKLFDSYSGSATGALCTIHLGPVAPRATSARKKMTPGRYRLFLQAWTANQSSVSGSLDMGLWSTACKWNPIAP